VFREGPLVDWSKFREARFTRCPHDSVVSTTNAGIQRTVCEDCGIVSVSYVDAAVRVFPETGEARSVDKTGRRRATCKHCAEAATFIVPSGYVCNQHAWDLAAQQDMLGDDLWIPIRIDQKSDTLG
jgi:hypothetical protein